MEDPHPLLLLLQARQSHSQGIPRLCAFGLAEVVAEGILGKLHGGLRHFLILPLLDDQYVSRVCRPRQFEYLARRRQFFITWARRDQVRSQEGEV